MSKQNSTVATQPHDRFKVRRSIALMSAALLAVMAAVVLVVILAGSADMADRLNAVQGFAGVLVTAFVTLIGGYGISAHMDDRQHIDKGLNPLGDGVPVSPYDGPNIKASQHTGLPGTGQHAPSPAAPSEGFDPMAMAARYANQNVDKIRPKLPAMTKETK